MANRASSKIKYYMYDVGSITMTIELSEFYYLIGAAVAYLAILIAYNAIGGRKKKSKKA